MTDNTTSGARQESAQQAADATKNVHALLRRLKLTDWITAIGTLVIAAATVATAFLAAAQLRDAEKASGDQTALANATVELSAYAQRQAKMDRAWVALANVAPGIDPLQVINPVTPIPSGSQVSIAIQNGGKYVAALQSYKVGTGVYQTMPTKPPYEGSPELGGTIMLPGAIVQNSATPYRPTPADLADMASGKKTYFIYASIEYADTIDPDKNQTVNSFPGKAPHSKEVAGTEIHHTHICIYYNYTQKGFKNCASYNDAR